jgi:hypothetical protein
LGVGRKADDLALVRTVAKSREMEIGYNLAETSSGRLWLIEDCFVNDDDDDLAA